MKKQLIISILAAFVTAQVTPSQTITETFGSGTNQFSIDFVRVGNPGNAADTTGLPNPVGAVSYIYNIGKYEVSRDMINKANAAGGLGIGMWDMSPYGANGANRPATGITWYSAAKFVNYLNSSSGNKEAYKFDASGNFQLWSSTDAGYNANNLFRNSLAKFFLASLDEWYKAAYGSPSGIWYNYPTGSDSAPQAVSGGSVGAVYNGQGAPADITNAGGLSPYGTMAQGGNVWEWVETAYDGINDSVGEVRTVRGGGWGNGAYDLVVTGNSSFPTTPTNVDFGFRVASVPEPSALSLLAVGLGGLAILARRRRV